MTGSQERFPTPLRFVAVSLALVAVAVLAPRPADAAPTPQQVQHAKDRVAALTRVIRQKQSTLAVIRQKADEVANELVLQQGQLEKLTAELLATQRALGKARLHYNSVVSLLNERARSVFMQGPGSNVEFLLGATSLADLSDRVQFVDAVARSDADLAQQVQNTKNELSIKRGTLEKLTVRQQAVVADVRKKNAKVQGWLGRMQDIVNQIADQKRQAVRYAAKVSRAYQAYVRSHFSSTISGPQSIALPPGYVNPLQHCPVGQPYAYGDGFGAPRYAGGYHLHMGVDILAPMGTPIYATFDGYASENPNGLGGLAVEVHGASGYTYNAHLSAYSDHSVGSVHTGDLIGYVGDTGDAQGGPPHDHFEYHPNSIPADWPASYYGYSVIDGAINPYPLLLQVCG